MTGLNIEHAHREVARRHQPMRFTDERHNDRHADRREPDPRPDEGPEPGEAVLGPVRSLPVDQLKFGFSPRRGSHDEGHVLALAETLPQLPPVLVQASTMRVIDGVHRVLAARSTGTRWIDAVLFHGDDEAARVLAISRNVRHGKPLTISERRDAACGLLASNFEWSDRRVGSMCGLSPKSVGSLRERLRATDDLPQLRERVGRDGKTRPTDPVKLRLRVAELLRTSSTMSNRAIARATGAAQGTVADVRRRLESGADVIPPRLATDEHRSWIEAQQELLATSDDAALQANEILCAFVSWFEAHRIEDADWWRFVPTIPRSRIYEIADAARLCAKSWSSFSSTLEARVSGR